MTRLDEIDAFGRRYVMTEALPADFALNQPLSHFALAVLDVLDPASDTFTLDVVSVVEAVLEAPRPLLMAQQHAARGEAIGALKAEGVDYDERMALIEDVTWPQPLADLLEPLYETYRERHPWLSPDALAPKSVVREMWEQGMGFTDVVGRYQVARSEGLVLRYLTDAYRALRQTVPATHRTEELDLLVEWLGETVRQVDSSLLDEWEALSDPGAREPRGARPRAAAATAPAQPARPGLRRDDAQRAVATGRPGRQGRPRRAGGARDARARSSPGTDWDRAIEDYYAEHKQVLTDADARGPDLLTVVRGDAAWRATQTIHDPAGHHDWVIEAEVDLAASDETGEAVVRTISMRQLRSDPPPRVSPMSPCRHC